MEPLSEYVKRAALEKLKGGADWPSPEAETVDRRASVAEFPSELFQCPACGQLLAPACRVCVACKHTINPAEIGRPQELVSPAVPAPGSEPRPEPVRYPWRIFLVVLSIGLILGQIFLSLWGEQKGPLVIQSVPILVGLWVFFDALRRRIPRVFIKPLSATGLEGMPRISQANHVGKPGDTAKSPGRYRMYW